MNPKDDEMAMRKIVKIENVNIIITLIFMTICAFFPFFSINAIVYAILCVISLILLFEELVFRIIMRCPLFRIAMQSIVCIIWIVVLIQAFWKI